MSNSQTLDPIIEHLAVQRLVAPGVLDHRRLGSQWVVPQSGQALVGRLVARMAGQATAIQASMFWPRFTHPVVDNASGAAETVSLPQQAALMRRAVGVDDVVVTVPSVNASVVGTTSSMSRALTSPLAQSQVAPDPAGRVAAASRNDTDDAAQSVASLPSSTLATRLALRGQMPGVIRAHEFNHSVGARPGVTAISLPMTVRLLARSSGTSESGLSAGPSHRQLKTAQRIEIWRAQDAPGLTPSQMLASSLGEVQSHKPLPHVGAAAGRESPDRTSSGAAAAPVVDAAAVAEPSPPVIWRAADSPDKVPTDTSKPTQSAGDESAAAKLDGPRQVFSSLSMPITSTVPAALELVQRRSSEPHPLPHANAATISQAMAANMESAGPLPHALQPRDQSAPGTLASSAAQTTSSSSQEALPHASTALTTAAASSTTARIERAAAVAEPMRPAVQREANGPNNASTDTSTPVHADGDGSATTKLGGPPQVFTGPSLPITSTVPAVLELVQRRSSTPHPLPHANAATISQAMAANMESAGPLPHALQPRDQSTPCMLASSGIRAPSSSSQGALRHASKPLSTAVTSSTAARIERAAAVAELMPPVVRRAADSSGHVFTDPSKPIRSDGDGRAAAKPVRPTQVFARPAAALSVLGQVDGPSLTARMSLPIPGVLQRKSEYPLTLQLASRSSMAFDAATAAELDSSSAAAGVVAGSSVADTHLTHSEALAVAAGRSADHGTAAPQVTPTASMQLASAPIAVLETGRESLQPFPMVWRKQSTPVQQGGAAVAAITTPSTLFARQQDSVPPSTEASPTITAQSAPLAAFDLEHIIEQVGRRLARRLEVERERKGIRSWR